MSTVVPFLLAAIVLFLIGLLIWGFKRIRSASTPTLFDEPRDHFYIWLLVLAVFTTGVFFAYLLLIYPF